MSGSETNMKSYDGSCHCGQVSYTVKLPGPIEEQTVNTCSICSINGYILVYTKTPYVTFHNKDDAVKEYCFGTMNYPHGFCPNCGTSVYARAIDGEWGGMFAINGRTLKDVDISSLDIKPLDGKNKA